jgi:hypothetical protein
MSQHLFKLQHAAKKTVAELCDEAESHGITTRDDMITVGGNMKRVSRVFVDINVRPPLTSVGWVLDDNSTFCLECMRDFTFFFRRHHCRACGLLVCSACSLSAVYIDDYDNELGKQRVCKQCNPEVLYFFFILLNLTKNMNMLMFICPWSSQSQHK